MNLMDYDAESATLNLDARELLMLMALVQEGRDSFECEEKTGAALDQLLCSAVASVLAAQCNNDLLMTASNDDGFPDMPQTSQLQ